MFTKYNAEKESENDCHAIYKITNQLLLQLFLPSSRVYNDEA